MKCDYLDDFNFDYDRFENVFYDSRSSETDVGCVYYFPLSTLENFFRIQCRIKVEQIQYYYIFYDLGVFLFITLCLVCMLVWQNMRLDSIIDSGHSFFFVFFSVHAYREEFTILPCFLFIHAVCLISPSTHFCIFFIQIFYLRP